MLLTAGMTWPLVSQLASAIPGDGFDGWQNVWNLWWMREAWLVRHQTAYFSDMIHFPTGSDLRFQTMAPFNGLTFLNIQTSTGLLPAYNAAVIFSFVVGGYGAYLLALYALGPTFNWIFRTGHGSEPTSAYGTANKSYWVWLLHGSAFLAGAIYAFAPYHFAHLLGHLQLIVLQWIPFYFLYLLRGLDRTRRGTSTLTADTLRSALFLILVGLCDWYYAMYCLFFTVLIAIVELLRRRLSWRQIGLMVGTGALFALILAPLLIPMAMGAGQATWSNTSLNRSYEEILTLSADLYAFFTPQVFHPVWGPWALARSAAFTATPSEYTVFAGYTVLLLAAIALMTIRNHNSDKITPFPSQHDPPWTRPLFWISTAGIFTLLALGPVLKINGRSDLLPGGGHIPLPYTLLYEAVPFIKLSRSVSRLDVIVMLSLGVAASFGSLGLAGRLLGRSNRPQTSPTSVHWGILSVPLVALLVVLFEFLPVPYPMSSPDTPSWYQTLARDPAPKAVLNLPANFERPGYLLFQTTHGKPIAGGYVTRDDPRIYRERAPVLSHFWWLDTDINTSRFDLSRQGIQVLHDLLGVGWVVLDRYKMPASPVRTLTEAMTQQIFGPAGVKPIHETQRITVYPVPEPRQRAPYLILAPGWPSRQVDRQGRAYRELAVGQAGLELRYPSADDIILELVASAPLDSQLTLQDQDGNILARWISDGEEQTWQTDPRRFTSDPSELFLAYQGPPGTSATIYEVRVLR
jgi:hypothetical protein